LKKFFEMCRISQKKKKKIKNSSSNRISLSLKMMMMGDIPILDELENDKNEKLDRPSYFPRGSLLCSLLLAMAQNDLNHLPHYQKGIVFMISYPLYDGGITIANGGKERKCNQTISTKTNLSLSLSLSLPQFDTFFILFYFIFYFFIFICVYLLY
jgi:hypothetical protein